MNPISNPFSPQSHKINAFLAKLTKKRKQSKIEKIGFPMNEIWENLSHFSQLLIWICQNAIIDYSRINCLKNLITLNLETNRIEQISNF